MRAAAIAPLFALGAACSPPAMIPVPLVPRGQGATAEEQRIGVACDGLAPAPAEDAGEEILPALGARCRFRAEVTVRNLTTVPLRVPVELRARGAAEVRADLDGDGLEEPANGEGWTGGELGLGAAEVRTLRARGWIYPAEGPWDRMAVRALAARHPVLAWHTGERRLRFNVAPGAWVFDAEVPPSALRIERPAAWALEMSAASAREAAAPATAPGRAATEHTSEREQRASGVMIKPGSAVDVGGPVLGVGLTREGDARGWRALGAAGFELGLSDWVLGSLLIDTDFDRRLTVAPGVEVATPYLRAWWLPSLALGFGVPAQLLGTPALGGRAQITMAYPYFGVTAYADWWPALESTEQAVLVRASL